MGAEVQAAEDHAQADQRAEHPDPHAAHFIGQPQPHHHRHLRVAAGQAVAFADAVVEAEFQRRARVLEVVLEQGVEPGGDGDQHQQAEEGALVPGPETEGNGQQQEGAVAEPGESVGDMGELWRAQWQHPIQAVQKFVHDESLCLLFFMGSH
ncbi:hypothetical protein D3C80_1627090 [compost metagenome]